MLSEGRSVTSMESLLTREVGASSEELRKCRKSRGRSRS